MKQYLVVHRHPDGLVTVMPIVFGSAVPAGIHCEHLNRLDHDGKGGLGGHRYAVAAVPDTLVVSTVAPKAAPSDKPRVYSDAELTQMAQV